VPPLPVASPPVVVTLYCACSPVSPSTNKSTAHNFNPVKLLCAHLVRFNRVNRLCRILSFFLVVNIRFYPCFKFVLELAPMNANGLWYDFVPGLRGDFLSVYNDLFYEPQTFKNLANPHYIYILLN